MRKENAKSSDAVDDTEGFGEESFLRRWSSRKRRARRGEAEDTAPVRLGETPTSDDVDVSDGPERVLTDEDMPPIESLNEDSDYSGFMSPGVSESLRRLALRKMFLSSKYNFTDGLDDYADDFTKFAPLGNIVTADMRHQMEMQAQRAKEKLEEEAQAAMGEAPAGEGDGAETTVAASDEGEETGGPENQTLDSDDSIPDQSGSKTSGDDDSRSG